MVVSNFRSRLRPENEAELQEPAVRLMQLAESMPGFLSDELYVAADGERCSAVEFETHELLLAWRELPEHREAQRLGRERFYQACTLHVAEPLRESRFAR